MTHGCMSIMKDLPLYYMDKIFTNSCMSTIKIYLCIILNDNYHEWLYEYYEGSIVVLY